VCEPPAVGVECGVLCRLCFGVSFSLVLVSSLSARSSLPAPGTILQAVHLPKFYIIHAWGADFKQMVECVLR
jgi:hypothetical protein